MLLGQWSKPSTPFQATAIASSGNSFWICGANASIASSSDGGDHWNLLTSKEGAGTLLSIHWANEQLAVAGGTGGLILLSTDKGANWKTVPVSFSEPVLDLSFSDSNHGLVLTTAAVLYTSDGGKTWRAVPLPPSPELSRFKYVLALATLDETHAAILVKEGPAQYYDGRLVTTGDSGATWKTAEIEHTTLNNLLVTHGQLWLVGTEVIEREKRGGHAVPVTFHSADAAAWDRGPRPLVDTNYACRPEGCLMWNGAWFDPFVQAGKIHTFPSLTSLSVRWAATEDRICTLTPDLECADTHLDTTLPERGSGAPQLAATELRATPADAGGKCIRCDYPRILVSEQFAGRATVRLEIHGRPDGTVSSVEVLRSPTPEIGEALSKAADTWIFYPILRDGVAAPTKRTVDLPVMVIKPQ
jgi:hypothetical protein